MLSGNIELAKRKLRKGRAVLLPGQAQIHERIASELPRNTEAVVVEIEDAYGFQEPALYERGEWKAPGTQKVKALRSLRDDPLGRLHARGQIDEACFNAGRHWQALYERASIGGVRAIDTTNEPVDGGGTYPDPITDGQRKAVKELQRARSMLGKEGDELVRDILGEGCWIEMAAARRGMTKKHEIEFIGRRFRECLMTLSVVYRYAM